MSVKERICLELDGLSEADLGEIEEFIAFLRFRSRTGLRPEIDMSQMRALYAAFSDEDQLLAEEGMTDFNAELTREDSK